MPLNAYSCLHFPKRFSFPPILCINNSIKHTQPNCFVYLGQTKWIIYDSDILDRRNIRDLQRIQAAEDMAIFNAIDQLIIDNP